MSAPAAATRISGELTECLSTPRNGSKLVPALIKVMVTYFVDIAKVTDVGDLSLDDPDELEDAANEAWLASYGEAVPRVHAHRVRKWGGEVITKGKVSVESPLAGDRVGEIGEDVRLSAARKELADMDGLTTQEKEKAMKDMAAQGLTGARIIGLSLSLCLGKVMKPSACVGLKYGEDPSLGELAKQARKATAKTLEKVLKSKDYTDVGAFFTGLMSKFAADSMVEESALIGAWWAETAGCFVGEKDLLFKYLEEYFDKYAGRGLPVLVDTVLVTRLRNAAGSGVGKDDLKKLVAEVAELKTSLSKSKEAFNTLKQQVDTKFKKPTAEEQDERRKNVICNYCKEKGHYKSECPKLKSDKED